jgi:hypothetical protein
MPPSPRLLHNHDTGAAMCDETTRLDTYYQPRVSGIAAVKAFPRGFAPPFRTSTVLAATYGSLGRKVLVRRTNRCTVLTLALKLPSPRRIADLTTGGADSNVGGGDLEALLYVRILSSSSPRKLAISSHVSDDQEGIAEALITDANSRIENVEGVTVLGKQGIGAKPTQ